MSRRTLLLAGATGLVGREVLRLALAARVDVHALVRRPAPQPAANGPVPALANLHWHTVDYTHLGALPPAHEAVCALGTTQAVAGSEAAFRAVDHDAVLAFARAARQAGVKRFAVVSALGADPRSRNLYSRVKGETEQALQALDFPVLLVVRPSLLAGDRASLGQPARPLERWALAAAGPISRLLPAAWRPIEAATVARAVLRALPASAPGTRILASAELHPLGQP